MAKAKANGASSYPGLALPKPIHKKKKYKRPPFESGTLTHCQYCGMVPNGYVIIEKHHIKPVGMCGTRDPKTADSDNEFWACKGPGSKNCHDHAQAYRPGYMPDDLRRKKQGDAERIKDYRTLVELL